MFEKLRKYNIILASASPRRQDLLKHLGLPFKVEVRPVDENKFESEMTAEDVALLLSRRKANAFLREDLTNNQLLITADTVVCLEGEILGKPGNRHEAIDILNKLSGKKHEVITGVCIRTLQKETNFSVSTSVYFKKLRQEEIEYYVDHFKPYDKAGAYGIQEWIGYIGIEKIEGSFYNVMGLPVLRLYEELMNY
jgi:septum formation protein